MIRGPPRSTRSGASAASGVYKRQVQQRRGVPLRHHEPIVVGIGRVPGVEAHLGEGQGGHDVGRRAAGRGVAAAGRGRRADGLCLLYTSPSP